MQPIKLLLDTHALLWAIGESSKLSEKAIEEIKNPYNKVLVSTVSLWEIAIKHAIGKLALSFDILNIPEYCETMGFELIPLDWADALNSVQLPQKGDHKDPFDRMLIYQCIRNQYILISADTEVAPYTENGLNLLW